jgi:glyoxylase-like metal-dependent hydrolase (beta-lactamase superfamily II)
MSTLRENLVLLEHSDPGARRARLSTNAYAVLGPGGALLIDASILTMVPFLHDLAGRGFAPAALVISHRHVAGTGDALRAISDEFKIPVLLHPIDAGHPQASFARVRYEDPVGHPVLASFGLEAILFPGHTSGSIVLYSADNGGMLFTADAAMGPNADQTAAGIERLIRPPAELSTDDRELRRQWLSFSRPVASVLPYHGTGYVDRAADMQQIMAPLRREEPTIGLA